MAVVEKNEIMKRRKDWRGWKGRDVWSEEEEDGEGRLREDGWADRRERMEREKIKGRIETKKG